MSSKLGRSRQTGLMPPCRIYMPYNIFKHLANISRGYGADCTVNKTNMTLEITSLSSAYKIFSPARFGGENLLKRRHFQKVVLKGRCIFQFKGRAAVIVSKVTPIVMEYSFKKEKLTISFYIQRYDKDDFAIDLSLQTLVNAKNRS